MFLMFSTISGARSDPDAVIIARTDARSEHGIDDAIRRGQAFADAGADVVFVEAPESIDEMEKICRAIDKPLLANMVDGGRTPVLSADELRQIGYQIAIFTGTGFLAMGAAVESAYRHLKTTGSSSGLPTPLHDFDDFSRLMGFTRIWEFEKKWADD